MDYPFPRQIQQSGLLSPHDSEEDEVSTSSSVEAEIIRQQQRRSMRTMGRVVVVFLATLGLLLWMLLTGPIKHSSTMPVAQDMKGDYLADFGGHAECGITSQSIYVSPDFNDKRKPKHKVLCPTRKLLLQALSGGGRHGFDTPYVPAECTYRWYTTNEICMILERFDAVIFVGDDLLRNIYAAFNILLTENIAHGALKYQEMHIAEKKECHCEGQLNSAECVKDQVTDHKIFEEGDSGNAAGRVPYRCKRTPHQFLPISGSPAAEDLHDHFTSVLKGDPDAYKPVPVIHTLGLSTSLSWPDATHSMDEWVSLADASGRNVPFLWIGPNAAGHLKPPTRIMSEGNNALWHYTLEMAKEARSRDLDALGMYNLTLQASSWDGSGYGLRVGLVQAMMVINWLARVEST